MVKGSHLSPEHKNKISTSMKRYKAQAMFNPLPMDNIAPSDPLLINSTKDVIKINKEEHTPEEIKERLVDNYTPYFRNTSIDITYHPKNWEPGEILNILSTPQQWVKAQLYSSMEVYWPRLLKNLSFIKDCIKSQKFVLKSVNDSATDGKYYIVDRAIKNMKSDVVFNINNFADFISDILDCYGKGISVSEILWVESEDGLLLPEGTKIISPILYDYDITNQRLYMKYGDREFMPDKFIVSIYRNRSTTNMSTFGVYQCLAWLFSAQTWARDYLWKLSEKFGLPLIRGTYPRDMDNNFKSAFNSMLANFGNSGYILGPTGIEIEMLASGINATNNPQQALLDYCDKMCDIVMLGQELSTQTGKEGGGSYALGKMHMMKENHILHNLTDLVLNVLNYSYIPSILNVNEQNTEDMPYFVVEEEKDMEEVLKKIEVNKALKSCGYEDVNFITNMREIYGFELKEVEPLQEEKNIIDKMEQKQEKEMIKDQL